jgi:hypothetical protein
VIITTDTYVLGIVRHLKGVTNIVRRMEQTDRQELVDEINRTHWDVARKAAMRAYIIE